MRNINNVTITEGNKSIIVNYAEYENNKSLFTGIIGKKMINRLIANNINFTLIEE